LLVLGIETATQICGVAIVKGGNLLAEYRLNIKNAHARKLVGAIEKLWLDCGISASDLNGIAVSIGPGSFTGLRIGVSTAKGLALANSLPITGVSTLQALAAQAPIRNGLVCPVIRSRANEVYAALYERVDFQDKLVEEVAVLTLEAFSGFAPKGATIVGEPAELMQPLASQQDYYIVPKEFSLLSAFTVARIGYEQISAGQVADLATLEPMYFQEFIASKPKKTPALLGEDDGDS